MKTNLFSFQNFKYDKGYINRRGRLDTGDVSLKMSRFLRNRNITWDP